MTVAVMGNYSNTKKNSFWMHYCQISFHVANKIVFHWAYQSSVTSRKTINKRSDIKFVSTKLASGLKDHLPTDVL